MKKIIFAAALILASGAANAQQCTATTKKGSQCSRKAQQGQQYCKQHNPATVKCAATTKSGKPCQLQPQKESKYCHIHHK